MIVVDTSALVDALTGPRRSAPRLRQAISDGHRLALPAIVLFEWLRGPRRPDEIAAQEALFPSAEAMTFGPDEAAVAAALYRRVARPRGREIDLAIAASAIRYDAALWTLNRDDFADVPGLELY